MVPARGTVNASLRSPVRSIVPPRIVIPGTEVPNPIALDPSALQLD